MVANMYPTWKAIQSTCHEIKILEQRWNKFVSGKLKGGHGPKALTLKEEDELASYIEEMANRGVPIGRKEVKYLAVQMEATHPDGNSVFKHSEGMYNWSYLYVQLQPVSSEYECIKSWKK